MSKKIRVAINGFGRIGRAFFREAVQNNKELDIVALNDLGDLDNLIYLLRYDSAYGSFDEKIEKIDFNNFSVGKDKVSYLSEKDPTKLPWRDMKIDVVVESSGLFTSYEKAKAHIDAGAKRVVISAPAKDEAPEGIAGATVLLGVNEEKFESSIITSNASCTTNATSPLIAILHEKIGIEKAILNTVHGYTASQSLVDGINKKDWREGRAAAQNIVPTSTGAAIAVTKAFPALTGSFDGISMRVPVITGSIVDVTFIAKKSTSVEEVNSILEDASKTERWKEIFSVTREELVSSDIVGSSYASIADLSMTRVVGGNLVKVLAWYDNEKGYSRTLLNHVIKIGHSIK